MREFIMRDFEGKVAVVTGAASGMGRAFSERFASEGMSVVLADIEEGALKTAVTELEQQERRVLGVVTDTTSKESVQSLADRAFDEFGAVHIVCNNAGVASMNDAGMSPTAIWEVPDGDWQWTVNVNFWGVVYGMQAFVPRMLEGGEDGHIVNTASLAAITPTGGVYGATKHAVLALTETLYQNLKQRNAKVSASVLCPGFVRTSIFNAERNRPAELGGTQADGGESADQIRALLERGKDPDEIAGQVFEAIRDDRFYILPHPAWDLAVRRRTEHILERGSPYELDFMELIRNMPEGEKL